MSVSFYNGVAGYITDIADHVSRMKEAVTMITEHTTATVDTVLADSSSAYGVILHIGGDRYAGLSVSVEGSTCQSEVSIGTKSGGAYTKTNTFSKTLGTITNYPVMNQLVVINEGDVWELRYMYQPYTAHIDHLLRASKVVSSLDGSAHWTGGITFHASNMFVDAVSDYPQNDYMLINGQDWLMQRWASEMGRLNVNDGTMLLFPALLYVEVTNYLGMPMVGNQICYSMSARESLNIARFTEFKVNRQLFVSIGRIAVRSTQQ